MPGLLTSLRIPRTFIYQWLVLLSVLLLFGGYITWNLYAEYQATTARENERLTKQAHVIYDNLNSQFTAFNRAIASIINDLPRWYAEDQQLHRANERLEIFASTMIGVRTINILDRTGKVIASNHSELLGVDFSQRAYFLAAKQAPNPQTLYVSPPFVSYMEPWVMVVGRALLDAHGALSGQVAVTLDTEAFKVLLDSVRYAEDMRSTLVHSSGLVFLAMPADAAQTGKDIGLPNTMFTRHIQSGRAVNLFTDTSYLVGGRRMVAALTFQPSALAMDKALIIFTSRSVALVYANWKRQVWNDGLLYAALLGIAILSLYRLQRYQLQATAKAACAQRNAEAQRQQLEARWRLVLEATNQGVWDWNAQTNRVYFSAVWKSMLGYAEDEIGDQRSEWESRIHPDDHSQVFADLQRHIDGIAANYQSTYRLRGKDGSYLWVLDRGQVLERAAAGQPLRVIGSHTDVTGAKELELELRTAKEAAETASRTKSEFVATMSHEIRTPMNAMLGMLQLLQHTALSAQQSDYVGKAQSAAQALLGLINDILDFSKIESGKLALECACFDLDELLRRLAVVLSAAVGDKPLEVLLDLDARLPHALYGDALRLQQVLLNLGNNAIKFTERGEVVISLQVVELTPERVRIAFAVRDTGIGIAADRLQAIFESFVQEHSATTRHYGGTGLGLPISQRLVRLMGGEINVISTRHLGSCFSFDLDFRCANAAPAPYPLPTNARPQLRVLVVDDNASARHILAGMVERFGWQCVTAASAIEALECLQQATRSGQRFDIVCVDWLMPELDGWQTLQLIRQQHSERAPAILMVSAHDHAKLLERPTDEIDLLAGYLVKPVTPSMLFNALVKAAGGHLVTTQPRSLISAQALSGLHLLLVEDNALNQQVASELLTHAGARVSLANNGREALDYVATATEDFDAILMDVQMPLMDGYAATRLLRSELGVTVPIIAMTANALHSDRAACLEAGMNDHIGKPIDVQELVAKLQQHCAHVSSILTELPAAISAAPTGQSDAEDLPKLPAGFALAEALQRLGNNRALYANLVEDFARNQADLVVKASDAWQREDWDSARRHLHTLKGLAATLGAQALSNQTAALESAMQKQNGAINAPALDWAERLPALETHLQNALAVLREAAQILVASVTLPILDDSAMANHAGLRDKLLELAALLDAKNMRAMDEYAQIKNVTGEYQAALGAAMSRLDFSQAHSIVAAWIASLPPC